MQREGTAQVQPPRGLCELGVCAHVCTQVAADQPDPRREACPAEVFVLDADGWVGLCRVSWGTQQPCSPLTEPNSL